MRNARVESTAQRATLVWGQDQVDRNQVSSYEYPSFIVWRPELKIQSQHIHNVARTTLECTNLIYWLI